MILVIETATALEAVFHDYEFNVEHPIAEEEFDYWTH